MRRSKANTLLTARPCLFCLWLQTPRQVEHSETGKPCTLHGAQRYSHQWLPERSLFTAEMSVPSSIFGWIQWQGDACALSYVKRGFSASHRNSTQQGVPQGHCSCCICCRNILKMCIFSAFFILGILKTNGIYNSTGEGTRKAIRFITTLIY